VKICFPYWWLYWCFGKRRGTRKDFLFSPYIIARQALCESSPANAGSLLLEQPASSSVRGDKALEWIYHLLGVLDSKASALMRLNGVMLAAAAFLLNPQYKSGQLITSLVAVSGIGSTLSIACCLLVVSVDWRFLKLVEKKPRQDGALELDFSEEFYHLQRVADSRQSCYRVGWLVSLTATVVFLFAIGLFFASLFLVD